MPCLYCRPGKDSVYVMGGWSGGWFYKAPTPNNGQRRIEQLRELEKKRHKRMRGAERKEEITDVLVLVLALIPPNVPLIKGGVHPFSLTLTVAH